MPSFYENEEDVYKCTKHPSRRRRTGICPACLREVLLTLCPDCAHQHPCPCCYSSSSSSIATTRMSDLIDNEPSFKRSRSIAVPFLQLRSGEEADGMSNRRTSSFSFMKLLLFKRVGREGDKTTEKKSSIVMMMMKSSSMTSESSGGGKGTRSGRGWYFPSPINVLRQSKISKLFVQQGSPLYRG